MTGLSDARHLRDHADADEFDTTHHYTYWTDETASQIGSTFFKTRYQRSSGSLRLLRLRIQTLIKWFYTYGGGI